MKIFISWSGSRSRALAEAMRDWLPLVLYYVEPWMSDTDIQAGERWAVEVATELDTSNLGIVCLTRENVSSSWILFESGALAKSLSGSRVIPLLLDLDVSDISGPLAQFQAKKSDKTGLRSVVQAINGSAEHPLPEQRERELFDMAWPKLESLIAGIEPSEAGPKPSRSQADILEEMVSGMRSIEIQIHELGVASGERFRSNTESPARVPFELVEMVLHRLAGPDDPLRFLLAGTLFHQEAPWMYELGLAVYRAGQSGTLEDRAAAANQFRSACRLLRRYLPDLSMRAESMVAGSTPAALLAVDHSRDDLNRWELERMELERRNASRGHS